MEQVSVKQSAKYGLVGFLLSITSLVVVLIQLSAFFEPKEKSSATVIGEIAAEIKQSAARALTGKPAPEPSKQEPDYNKLITYIAIFMAGIAVVLGGIGLYRHEPHRLPYLAIGIGLSSIVMQFVFWLALIICSVVLLTTITKNLDGIFE